MEYKIHRVKAEEKLKEICAKYDISIDKIKKANPNVRFFKTTFGVEYVACLQDVKIPISTPIVNDDTELLKDIIFEKKARYRCSQTNVTKALDSVTFSSDIKTQYLLSVAKHKNLFFHVLLEDYVYEIIPKELEASFELIKPVELLKNDIKFIQQDKKAQTSNILNFSLIEKKWKEFKDETLPNIDFYKKNKTTKSRICRGFYK